MQLPGLNIGIVADDLTGANDTALMFHLAGARANILLDWASLDTDAPSCAREDTVQRSQVWAVNTLSRHLDREAAARQVEAAVSLLRTHYGAEYFYKKIDSTLRGNIGRECLAFLEAVGGDCLIVVPAYPQQKRLTVGGYQLMNGMPIERTTIARDPLSPVRVSHLPTLLRQTVDPSLVGHIELATVLHGAGPILKELQECIAQGHRLVAIDATSDEDLAQIALSLEKIQKTARVYPAGSAGLADALTKRWLQQDGESLRHPEVALPPAPVLIVNGSTSEVTREQSRLLIENFSYYVPNTRLSLFEIPPTVLMGQEPDDALIAGILDALGTNSTVMLSAGLRQETVSRTMQLAAEARVPEHQLAERIEERLATLTQAVLLQRPNTTLVLTGGETTSRVCEALGLSTLQVMAEADTSIPLTCCQGTGDAVPRHWLVTKSGSFGTAEALANILGFLRAHETEPLAAELPS